MRLWALKLVLLLALVSIHASVKDATQISHRIKGRSSFNPRICKRCDGNWIKDREYFNVSIHASVKDATGLTTYETVSINVSIHASVKDATMM